MSRRTITVSLKEKPSDVLPILCRYSIHVAATTRGNAQETLLHCLSGADELCLILVSQVASPLDLTILEFS